MLARLVLYILLVTLASHGYNMKGTSRHRQNRLNTDILSYGSLFLPLPLNHSPSLSPSFLSSVCHSPFLFFDFCLFSFLLFSSFYSISPHPFSSLFPSYVNLSQQDYELLIFQFLSRSYGEMLPRAALQRFLSLTVHQCIKCMDIPLKIILLNNFSRQ